MRKLFLIVTVLLFLFITALGYTGNVQYEQGPIFSSKDAMQSRIYTLTWADAEGVEEVVKNLLSEQGSVAVVNRTNALIVVDYPYVLQKIDAILPKIDIKIADVMVEVTVIETSDRLLRTIGFDLGEYRGVFKYKGPVNLEKLDNDFYVSAGALGLTEGVVPFSAQQLVFSAIKRDKRTKMYTKQKIRVQSNKTASIRLTVDTPVSVQRHSYKDFDVAVHKAEIERALTGRILHVTPRVNPENIIMLDLRTEVITSERSQYYANTFDPFSRMAVSHIKLQDGDTVVFGTDVAYKSSNSQSTLPGTDVAIKEKDRSEKRVFVILVTANIL